MPERPGELRRMTSAELSQLGEQSLRDHLVAHAIVAHRKYAPLSEDKLATLLRDPECLRYPTRLVFELGEMAGHQFAQPEVDDRDPTRNSRVLYLRPPLRERPDLLPLAVAYMIPVINYGDPIADEHCLLYGATLLGLTSEEYYIQMCALADFVGAETRLTSRPRSCAPPSAGLAEA